MSDVVLTVETYSFDQCSLSQDYHTVDTLGSSIVSCACATGAVVMVESGGGRVSPHSRHPLESRDMIQCQVTRYRMNDLAGLSIVSSAGFLHRLAEEYLQICKLAPCRGVGSDDN